jgi:hypothetical protein
MNKCQAPPIDWRISEARKSPLRSGFPPAVPHETHEQPTEASPVAAANDAATKDCFVVDRPRTGARLAPTGRNAQAALRASRSTAASSEHAIAVAPLNEDVERPDS